MTTFLVVFGALGWLGYLYQSRQLEASRTLAEGHQVALMLAWEDNAKLLAASAQLLAATTRLNDAISEQTQTIIVPPSGGMVA